ncbi:hypothetical protein [Nostoc sp. 106C]|uniref:hypothetical protein n=1 Tax=Nostoc sp. 106C TaxID=1932667 RepID=UPI000A3A51C7|nr:hypothetical protein [Nostoc sp. 106C]OUL18183.1 hypothetical protein BV375_33950 [Nostoc sp. 106C]
MKHLLGKGFRFPSAAIIFQIGISDRCFFKFCSSVSIILHQMLQAGKPLRQSVLGDNPQDPTGEVPTPLTHWLPYIQSN